MINQKPNQYCKCLECGYLMPGIFSYRLREACFSCGGLPFDESGAPIRSKITAKLVEAMNEYGMKKYGHIHEIERRA